MFKDIRDQCEETLKSLHVTIISHNIFSKVDNVVNIFFWIGDQLINAYLELIRIHVSNSLLKYFTGKHTKKVFKR